MTVGASAEARWSKVVAQTWPYATAVTTVMFVSCVFVGWFVSWQGGADGHLSYVLAALDPALAAVCMLLVCLVKPDVFVGRRFRMPHTLSLPTLYLVLVYGIKSLSRSSGSAIVGYEGAGRFDLIWFDLTVLIQAWVVLALVMAAVGTFASEGEA